MNISRSLLKQNNASTEGGAIKWTHNKPFIDKFTIFENNLAVYGKNLAGFPIRMRVIFNSKITNQTFYDSFLQNSINILNFQSSGNPLDQNILLSLVDIYNQTVISSSSEYIFLYICIF